MSIESDRKSWRKRYYRVKHSDWYVKARKKREAKYWRRHPFKRIAKQLRKEDKLSTVTPFDLWKIAKRQKCICPLSGRQLTSNNMSADHIKHKSEGGQTVSVNIRLVTKEINLARHILTDEAFIEMCRDVHLTNQKSLIVLNHNKTEAR